MTVKAYEEDSPPPAVIMMWTGSPLNIPPGWVICDGANGTPDLIDDMIKGNNSMTSQPGNRGGQNSVTLNENHLPPHSHSASSNTSGSHNHQVGRDFAPEDYDLGAPQMNPNGVDEQSVAQDGEHSHAVSVSNSGGGGSFSNLPKSYSVHLITKL